MSRAGGSSLEEGRAAASERRWDAAFVHLADADGEIDGGLAPEDLETLGEAAWVASRYDEFFRAYERTFAAYVGQGREEEAAGVAAMLANEYFPRGELAVGGGWHHTAARLLEARPGARIPSISGRWRSDALECAVEIQRTLADHRVRHGFSPPVRTGVHACEALHSGSTYRSRGIHVGARIAARAGPGQILVSRASLSDADSGFALAHAEDARLKGVAEPIALVTVRWS
jgi:class 3 adenylate cyclase